MPVDPMDDIELRSVQLQFSNGRGSLSGNCDLRRVVTDKGEVLVAVQGDTSKPAILTYHDLGLNCMCRRPLTFSFFSLNCACARFDKPKQKTSHIIALLANHRINNSFSPLFHKCCVCTDATSFAGFFNYPTMRTLLENFCVYHVTAPGQEEGAPSLPEE